MEVSTTGATLNGWFTMENTIEMDDFGGSPISTKRPYVLVDDDLQAARIYLGVVDTC